MRLPGVNGSYEAAFVDEYFLFFWDGDFMALIAWYKLDGNSDDSSGNGLTGINNGVTWVSGKINNCGSFSNDYISVANNSIIDLLSAGSLSLWVKSNRAFPSDDASYKFRGPISKATSGGAGGQQYWIDWYGTNTFGNLRFGIGNLTTGISVETSQNSLTDWHYITATWDGNILKLYIDGILRNSRTQTIVLESLNTPLEIGRAFSNNGYSWDGLIDDVRVYDHALSAKEIKLLSQAKILHYNFNDPYEEPTSNIIPNSPTNSYPTVGNTHGTYQTNQYNDGAYFSIGTVGSVVDNIVNMSVVSRTLYTYDVLRPQTTGGGVTAGVDYFIKVVSSTQFSLHAYNSSQDGSQGYLNTSTYNFKVYDSIALDQRVSINATGFPTMWWGYPHLPNSSLVKEIIPDATYNDNFNGHSFIRLHCDHKSGATGDGMAYSVNPVVTAGLPYTWSFWYRAANAGAVGKSIGYQTYTGGTWMNSSVTAQYAWQRAIFTATPSTSGGTYLYWFPANGGKYDISEIQFEQKDHASIYTETTRDYNILDCSGNNINALTSSTYSPQWTSSEKLGGYGLFFSNTVSQYISTTMQSPTDQITMCTWFKSSTIGFSNYHIPMGSDSLYYEISVGTDGAIRTGLYIAGSRRVYNSGSGLLNGNWHHLALTFDGSYMRAYIDGIETGNWNHVGSLTGGSRTWYVGYSPTYGNKNAYQDDYRIYATALSAEDILNIYQSRANLDNIGNLFSNELKENIQPYNEIEDNLNSGTLSGILSTYTQAHCQVTLVNDYIKDDNYVYRVYRTPNLIYPTDGTVMWGGVKLDFNSYRRFKSNKKYKISFYYKGQTSNAISHFFFAYSVGWTSMGVGLTEGASRGTWYNSIPANYNNWTDWVYSYAIFTPGSIYQRGTDNHIYYCMAQLKIGWEYTSTGTLGTDIRFANIRVEEIDDDYTLVGVLTNGQVRAKELDELTGTSSNQAMQIVNDGTLIIDGEFSEVN